MPHCRNGKGLLRDNRELLPFDSPQPEQPTMDMQSVQLWGKSLNAIFNGTADRVYGDKQIVADEMFNNSADTLEIG